MPGGEAEEPDEFREAMDALDRRDQLTAIEHPVKPGRTSSSHDDDLRSIPRIFFDALERDYIAVTDRGGPLGCLVTLIVLGIIGLLLEKVVGLVSYLLSR